ncbi:hypothetical protein FA15DRAFT_644991 [Coprinopsis marcescibilis]|uniref:Uncharacterized protein n=1 Tax=Coprinopsis marcescibilis TaxID=230819 RepID=A0A5C3KNN7_COPMA|nr:hypothetical protein FA15DRAFT_644991 [Coprinopsis marcescibilis]
MSDTPLVLNRMSHNIETCQPNLMPFRIAYNGPAQMSTYMHVQSVTSTEELRKEQAPQASSSKISAQPSTEPMSDVQMIEASSQHEVQPLPEAVTHSLKVNQVIHSETELSNPATSTYGTANSTQSSTGDTTTRTDAPNRFISTFRGRIIQGLSVDLPKGYRGLVLKSPKPLEVSSAKSTSKVGKAGPPKGMGNNVTKPKGRLTRSAVSERVTEVEEVVVVADDSSMDVDDSQTESHVPTKNLTISGQFSSFVIWKPDHPVVEIQDEYFRSMHEWTAISAEVHRSEALVDCEP